MLKGLGLKKSRIVKVISWGSKLKGFKPLRLPGFCFFKVERLGVEEITLKD